MRKYARSSGMLFAAVAMLLSVLVFSAPDADAGHPPTGEFTHDERFLGNTCPADYAPNGALIGGWIGCRPVGKVPVGANAAECTEAENTGFTTMITGGYCTFDGVRPCGTHAAFIQAIGGGQCVRPVLWTPHVHAAATSPRPPYAVPACANSDLVQEVEALGYVGDLFSVDGVLHQIVSGPGCGFDCHDGFDANCDGKLGDFCAIELDLQWAYDINKCIDSLTSSAS